MDFDDISDDEFIEILKFDNPLEHEDKLYDIVSTVYIEIFWDTLEEFTNLWNKKRHRMQCRKIKKYPVAAKIDDSIQKEPIYFIDIGKRLLKALKDIHKKKPQYIKIMRIGEKFDTLYFAATYKIITQKKLPVKKKSS